MNHYLTNKATQPAWWEWPAMIISGFLSVIGVYVAFDQVWTDDFFVTLLAFLLLMGFLSWPLILTLRKRLRREGINHFLCVYSTELPRQVEQPEVAPGEKRPPASNAWVPAAAGLVMGGEVVRRLSEGTLDTGAKGKTD